MFPDAREDMFDATLSALLEIANSFPADFTKTPEEQVADITALGKVCIVVYASTIINVPNGYLHSELNFFSFSYLLVCVY